VKLQLAASIAALGVCLSGCARTVVIADQRPDPVVGAYGSPVSGAWALYVDAGDLAKVHSEDETFCPSYDWSVDVSGPMRATLARTFEPLADRVVPVDRPPSPQELRAAGLTGIIRIHGDEFRVRPTVEQGTSRSTAVVTAEIDAHIQVLGPHGQLVSETATGSGEGVSDSGIVCENNGDAIKVAAEGALRDLVHRLGEKFASAPELRQYPL
jgi:hypothetical protein